MTSLLVKDITDSEQCKRAAFELHACALVAAPADDLQDVEEDVDDVQVKVQRSEHVLLGTQRQLLVPQEQLRVHGQKLQHSAGSLLTEQKQRAKLKLATAPLTPLARLTRTRGRFRPPSLRLC